MIRFLQPQFRRHSVRLSPKSTNQSISRSFKQQTNPSKHRASLSAYHQSINQSVDVPKITDTEYDAIVIGGGHNGLVAANYLAMSGSVKKIAIVERRPVLGGAAITEEIFPSYHFSRASYLFSLMRPQIVNELQLKKYGLEFLFRDPNSFTPLLNQSNNQSKYLMLGTDQSMNHASIAQFSKRDAERFPLYEQHLSKLVQFFEPLLDYAPPGQSINQSTNQSFSDSFEERVDQLKFSMKMLKQSKNLGLEGLIEFHELMTSPASKVLDRWFESEPLVSTLATDCVIGAMTSPSTPGSGYVLFHHVMGEVDGRPGAWAYVKGGMGAVSTALMRAAHEKGIKTYTNSPVAKILTSSNQSINHVRGVELVDGQRLHAPIVISNASPIFTYLSLLDRDDLPSSFVEQINSLDTTSPVTKINVAFAGLPQFSCMMNEQLTGYTHGDPSVAGGPEHRGTIHLVENCAQIDAAYHDAVAGRVSERPVIEMTIPSVLDSTLAPSGHNVASLFTQYTPYEPASGPWNDESRKQYAERCFNVIEEYAPGFKQTIEHYEVLTPPDLERVFGLSGGNIFHTSMGLDQLFWLRPAPGTNAHRSPINGLYLCGAGAHPGGGVMGSPGRNAASIVLKDVAKKRVMLRK